MLKTLESTESTTRPEKGKVGVGSDGGENTHLNASTDSSTSANQIAVKYVEVDDGDGKSVEKSLKSWKIIKS